MRKYILLQLFLWVTISVSAQSYDVLNYNYNGTPAHGVKIKTNLPFQNGSQMVTLKIEGYNYGVAEPIDLTLVWYIYYDRFYFPAISSAGGYAPTVHLSNESGFVTIFIDDKQYYQRFKIRAFATGMAEVPSWFQGWYTLDEPVAGTQQLVMPYINRFRDNVFLPDGIWNNSGVGIGTTDLRGYKLAVNGNIRAKEVRVEATNWPDYVFEKNYKVRSLESLEEFIKVNKHLPEIPDKAQVDSQGVELGEMNKLLLKKIEELTLYVLELKKDTELLRLNNKEQREDLEKLKKRR